MNKDEVSITEDEFNRMKGKSGAVYIGSINQIINLNRIERVYKDKDRNQSNLFKLPEPRLEKIDVSKGMEKLFNKLKEKGLFKSYTNYEKWCNRSGMDKITSTNL